MSGKRVVLKTAVCPGCAVKGSLRKILWGMPMEEPDRSQYVIGGCCLPDTPQEYACIECDWAGTRAEVLSSVPGSTLRS